mmetsp:Transcript_19947/g.55030  ORF Transcript_19947/g.55030 Transcript_19947/m.55030 type:complete len:87 (+) Transcript_19947:1279-1539(+)
MFYTKLMSLEKALFLRRKCDAKAYGVTQGNELQSQLTPILKRFYFDTTDSTVLKLDLLRGVVFDFPPCSTSEGLVELDEEVDRVCC